MKKVLTVIASAIAIGLIAAVVFLGVVMFATKTGIVKNNSLNNAIDSISENIDPTIASVSTTVVVKNEKTFDSNYYSNYYNDLTELIEDVMPTVVSITNMQKFKQNGYSMFGFRVQPQEYEAPASGSGVIVGMTAEQVIILTNNHVVESSSSLSVTFNDSETVDAAIKGTAADKDLAIISVDKKNIKKEILNNIKTSKIGDSDNVRVGERVVAIGNALGIGQSVTSGIISAKDREIDGIDNSAKLLQTDAPINPGNSGGALINMKGELVGINVAKSSGNAIEGIGYVIPINVAGEVIDTLSKKKDRVAVDEKEQGQLGITARNIDSQIAESLDMPEGIYVVNIADDSPAKNSELREKDIIVAFDDQTVKTVSELQELLRYTKAGQEVKIKIKRLDGGSYVEKEIVVKLGKKKLDDNAQNQNKENETKKEQDKSNGQNPQQGQPEQGGGYYFDPFSDFDDIFRNFGGFGW